MGEMCHLLKSPCFVFNSCYNGTIKTLGKGFMKVRIRWIHQWMSLRCDSSCAWPGVDPAARENLRTGCSFSLLQGSVSISRCGIEPLFERTGFWAHQGRRPMRSSRSSMSWRSLLYRLCRISKSPLSTWQSTLWKSLFRDQHSQFLSDP